MEEPANIPRRGVLVLIPGLLFLPFRTSSSPDYCEESALLGAIFTNPLLARDAVSMVGIYDFKVPRHRTVYRGILGVLNGGNRVDVDSVSAWLDRRGLLQPVGGAVFLEELVGDTPNWRNYPHYAENILRRFE